MMDELHDIERLKKIQAEAKSERITTDRRNAEAQKTFDEAVKPVIIDFFQSIKSLGYGGKGKLLSSQLVTVRDTQGGKKYLEVQAEPAAPIVYDRDHSGEDTIIIPATCLDISYEDFVDSLNTRLEEIAKLQPGDTVWNGVDHDDPKPILDAHLEEKAAQLALAERAGRKSTIFTCIVLPIILFVIFIALPTIVFLVVLFSHK